MDHYAEGGVIVSDEPIVSDTTILDTDDEVVAMIKELIEARIRPAVQEDGGDIFYACVCFSQTREAVSRATY